MKLDFITLETPDVLDYINGQGLFNLAEQIRLNNEKPRCPDSCSILTEHEHRLSLTKLKELLHKKETEWGMQITRSKSCQWSNDFHERLAYLVLEKLTTVFEPKKVGHLEVDWESPNFLFEIKGRTYYCSGTAGEKIFCPFFWKYADLPELTGKPVLVILVGYQEVEAKNIFKCSNSDRTTLSQFKRGILDYANNHNMHFVNLSELLTELTLAKYIFI